METDLWFLARCLGPLHVLKEKLDVYIAEGHIAAHEKDHYAQVFETMLGQQRETNLHGARDVAGVAATTEPDEENRQMNEAELRHELAERERQMRTFQGQEGVATDQWRVYKEAIQVLEEGRAPLRLCLQASAGTGKAFSLKLCSCGRYSTATT